jgi:hypothetical protein
VKPARADLRSEATLKETPLIQMARQDVIDMEFFPDGAIDTRFALTSLRRATDATQGLSERWIRLGRRDSP